MYEYIFEQVLLYYLWLLTLTLAFSSFITFIKFNLRIKKTIIGKTAFYVSFSFLIWGIAAAVLALPSIAEIEVYIGAFLVMASLASLTAIFAAYHEALISAILAPSSEEKFLGSRLCCALSGLALTIAFVGVARFALNNPDLNAAMEGMSILTGLGFIFIAGSLTSLIQPKYQDELVYLGASVALVIAFVALIGHGLKIPSLYAPLPGGGTSISTALGFIVASLGVALTTKRGLQARIAKVALALSVLLISILAFIGYILQIPALYSASSFARLSVPTSICFFFIGLTLFWRAWKTL